MELCWLSDLGLSVMGDPSSMLPCLYAPPGGGVAASGLRKSDLVRGVFPNMPAGSGGLDAGVCALVPRPLPGVPCRCARRGILTRSLNNALFSMRPVPILFKQQLFLPKLPGLACIPEKLQPGTACLVPADGSPQACAPPHLSHHPRCATGCGRRCQMRSAACDCKGLHRAAPALWLRPPCLRCCTVRRWVAADSWHQGPPAPGSLPEAYEQRLYCYSWPATGPFSALACSLGERELGPVKPSVLQLARCNGQLPDSETSFN
eukprot:363378-Chlamydomonas_euryale.AAC.29